MGVISMSFDVIVEKRQNGYYVIVKRGDKRIVYNEGKIPNSGKGRFYRKLIEMARRKQVKRARLVAKSLTMRNILRIFFSGGGYYRAEYDLIFDVIEASQGDLDLVEVIE